MASDFLSIVFGLAYFVLTGVDDPGPLSLLCCIYLGDPSIPGVFYYNSIETDDP